MVRPTPARTRRVPARHPPQDRRAGPVLPPPAWPAGPRPGRNGRVRLSTEQDPDRPNPTFIPIANEFAEWLAKRTGGIAQIDELRARLHEDSARLRSTMQHIWGELASL